MNLLQCAPLCDSQGKIRYFIGAQIDVSGLAMDDAQMESLNKLKAQIDSQEAEASSDNRQDTKSEFQELGELFSPKELRNVNEHGGSLFQPVLDAGGRTWLMPESPREKDAGEVRIGGTAPMPPTPTSGSLVGVYKHVSYSCVIILLLENDTDRLIATVPTCPTVPIPSGSLHFAFPPNSRYTAISFLFANRGVNRTRRAAPRFDGRTKCHCSSSVGVSAIEGTWSIPLRALHPVAGQQRTSGCVDGGNC